MSFPQTGNVQLCVLLCAASAGAANLPSPVAVAQAFRSGGANSVMLDGSRSTEPQGLRLTYQWSVVAQPQGCTTQLSDSTAVRPEASLACPGDYAFRMIVTNAAGIGSQPALLRVSTGMAAPIADAGRNRIIGAPGDATPALLDGSRSVSPDGRPLRYQWSLTSLPEGSAAKLTDDSLAVTSFAPDKPGIYVAGLQVGVEGESLSAISYVTLSSGFIPGELISMNGVLAPQADAGQNQSASLGSLVQLDGGRSTNPSGAPVTYRWAILSAPPSSQAKLSDPGAARPSFTVDREGAYVLQLTACNGQACGVPATAVVTTGLALPIANAGAVQIVRLGSAVTLNGSHSVNPNRLPLSYAWSLNSRPPRSSATFADPSAVNPSFTADQPGTYVAQLKVTDANGLSSFSTVVASTEALPSGPPAASEIIGGEELTSGSGASPSNRGDFSVGNIEGTRESALSNSTADATPSIIIPVDAFVETGPGSGYPVLLSAPAPSDVTVTLTLSDPSNVTSISETSLFFPAGATKPTITPYISCQFLDTVEVTASAPGYASNTETVTFGFSLQFNGSALQLLTGHSFSIDLFGNFQPDQQPITLTSSDPTVATVPASIQPYDRVKVQATSKAGSAVITATTPNFQSATLPVTVSSKQPVSLSCVFGSIGLDLQFGCSASVSNASAPLPFTIVSSDPSKLLLSLSETTMGSGSISTTSQGGVSFVMQALAGSGNVSVIASVPGYATTTIPIRLVQSGFFFEQGTATVAAHTGSQLYSLAIWEEGYGEINSTVIRAGFTKGIEVLSSDTTVGTVSGTSFKSENGGSAKFTPLAAGVTILTVVQPTGHSETALPQGTRTLKVNVTGVNLTTCSPDPLGYDLQENCFIQLGPASNFPPGMNVTLTSNSPNLLLSSSETTAGTSSLVLPLGSTGGTAFLLQNAGASTGSATISVSIPGIPNATIICPFGPTSLSLEDHDSGPVLAGTHPNLTLSLVGPVNNQLLRPGITVPVTVTSSNPTIGTVANPVVIQYMDSTTLGNSSAPVTFNALSPGNTTLTAVPPVNFAAGANTLPLTVVTALHFTTSCNGLQIGTGLIAPCTLTLSQPAPSGGLQVSLLVNGEITPDNPESIDFSYTNHDISGAGINLFFAAGSTAQTFWVQNAFGTLGPTGFTVHAPAYADLIVPVNVVPSSFAFGQATTTASLANGTVSYVIYAVAVVGGKAGTREMLGPLSGNKSLYIANLRSSVGNPTNPVVFYTSNASASVPFKPLAAGTDALCIDQPSGFVETKDLNELTITVTNP